MRNLDRKVFYDAVRNTVNLTEQNVPGFEKVLDYILENDIPVDKAAYGLATAYWETGQTMKPVKEAYWLSETWRKNNLRYYPYYGRSLIQVTWKENYRKVAVMLGLPSEMFVDKPDLLLDWKYALPTLFKGMETGLYTGKDLDDYLDGVKESDKEDLREFSNARRIVNGTDKQVTIGKIALAFDRALRKALTGEVTKEDDIKSLKKEIDSMWVALAGWKTYLVAVATIAVAVAKAVGYDIPEEVWAVLGALGLAGLRDGMKK